MQDSQNVFRNVYSPGITVNDHTFIYAQNKWHLFHIWISKGKDDVIGHATSDDLMKWNTEKDILKKEPPPSWEFAPGANAPYVYQWKDVYYLFYSRYDRKQHIGVAMSHDLFNWKKYEKNPVFHPAPAFSPWENDNETNQYRPYCCRDPHVMSIDGRFVMYYVCMTNELNLSAVAYAVSDDLINWQDKGSAAVRPVLPYKTAMCESPCVVSIGKCWYLFFKLGHYTHYSISDSPFDFKDTKILAEIHASEVFEWNGRWYISDCGDEGLNLAGIDFSSKEPRLFPL